MKCAIPLVAAAILAAASPSARAGTDHLGGFRSVAGEETARALWVNPARIGMRGHATSAIELVWLGTPEGESGKLQTLSLAAGSNRAVYGFQWEFDDVSGIADWVVSTGGHTTLRNGTAFGSTLEYRGGEDDTFDATAGVSIPVGGLVAALVVRDLLEADTDGVATDRTWRAGAAYRSAQLRGFASYDYLGASGRDSEHWFGATVDALRELRLSYFTNTDGDWNAALSFGFGRSSLSAGRYEPDEGDTGGFATARRDFAALDWDSRAARRSRPRH